MLLHVIEASPDWPVAAALDDRNSWVTLLRERSLRSARRNADAYQVYRPSVLRLCHPFPPCRPVTVFVDVLSAWDVLRHGHANLWTLVGRERSWPRLDPSAAASRGLRRISRCSRRPMRGSEASCSSITRVPISLTGSVVPRELICISSRCSAAIRSASYASSWAQIRAEGAAADSFLQSPPRPLKALLEHVGEQDRR